MSAKIQNLLEQANFSEAEDSSVNLAKRTFSNEIEAKDFFSQTKPKLFSIEEWNANSTPSSFELFDESGNISDTKTITQNKFIRIGLPASGKFDWVKVIEIDDAPDELVITVQPTYDPTETSPDKSVTSHFFKSEATNNFCLQRDDTSVALYVIGLNEKANVKEADNPIEAVRNVAAANLGYFFGAQKAMWKEFCKNFLELKK